jgi:hypothetical protein
MCDEERRQKVSSADIFVSEDKCWEHKNCIERKNISIEHKNERIEQFVSDLRENILRGILKEQTKILSNLQCFKRFSVDSKNTKLVRV